MGAVQEEAATFQGLVSTYGGPRRFRRFGPLGPAYEILADQDSAFTVVVLESGEVFDYRRDRADADPDADA